MSRYTYLIEYFFQEEPYTKYRAFFQTDEVFKECVVSYGDLHHSIIVTEELYSFFMYDSQKQGRAHFIMPNNPIHVKVLKAIDRGKIEKTSILPNQSKEEILEALCPQYRKRVILKQLLDEVEETYKVATLPKLDKACIVLLLRDNCFLFSSRIANNFSLFRRKLLAYYGVEDVSYKENHCKVRKEELRSLHPNLWREIRKKQ